MSGYIKLLKELNNRIANEINEIAKEKTAPIATANLKKDIGIRHISSKKITIGNTNKALYAKFVHEGTKPYIIKPKKKRALARKNSDGAYVFFGKKVNHPSIKSNPYFINALNEYKKSGGFKRAVDSFLAKAGESLVDKIKLNEQIR